MDIFTLKNQSNYQIKQTDWKHDKQALKLVREQVFIQEQSVPEDLEWDKEDETAIHLLAINKDGQAVGTARLLENGKIGRMAVLPDWRHQGIGSSLLSTLLEICRVKKTQPFLEAQTQAVGFYQPFGFVTEGKEFMDAGIPHFRMQYQPSKDKTCYRFDSRDENREVALNMIRLADRHVRIITPDLESPVYDQPDFIRSLTRLATKSSHSKIQILVNESNKAVKSGHRLIELARKLSSSIFIHNPPVDMKTEESMLLIDCKACLQKKNGLLYTGKYCMYNPLKTRELEKQFDEIWEKSQPDPEMRRLFI